MTTPFPPLSYIPRGVLAGLGEAALQGQTGCRVGAPVSLASVFLLMEVSPRFCSNKQGKGLRDAQDRGPAKEDLAQLQHQQ